MPFISTAPARRAFRWLVTLGDEMPLSIDDTHWFVTWPTASSTNDVPRTGLPGIQHATAAAVLDRGAWSGLRATATTHNRRERYRAGSSVFAAVNPPRLLISAQVAVSWAAILRPLRSREGMFDRWERVRRSTSARVVVLRRSKDGGLGSSSCPQVLSVDATPSLKAVRPCTCDPILLLACGSWPRCARGGVSNRPPVQRVSARTPVPGQ